MLFYIGDKYEEVVVDDNIRKNRNKAKSWKYGYDESIDTIIISKDGTLGEIYYVNGIKIGFPQKPDHKEIINWDKTPQNQKWKRDPIPDGLNDETQFDNKYLDYIETQFRKREEGIWIYLNGKPVYMTGTYWFFLSWYKEEDEYPSFRVIQNELMIFWEACKADPRCYGIMYLKNRRFGWSALCNSEKLEVGTRTENKLLGMISKKGNDAKKLFKRLVTAFKRLPVFFQPEVDGQSTPKTELIFSEPSKKRKTGEKITEDSGLDTSITWANTEPNAFDGDKMFRISGDECFGIGTKILMSDLTFKNIEEIVVGDYVTIEGGKKIRVGRTFSGTDEMFKVSQPYSTDYVVNSKHRLYLERRSRLKETIGEGVKILKPNQYLELSKHVKRTTYGVRSLGLNFDKKEVKIEPYILGLWLGDGLNDGATILVNIEKDNEIISEIERYVSENNFSLSVKNTSESIICKKFTINRPENELHLNGRIKQNNFRTWLKEYDLMKNKHIPFDYLENDTYTRLELLAGLLDSDGYLCHKNNSYHYQLCLSKKDLFDNALFLIRSLGFKASTSIKKTNYNTICYKLNIHGDLSTIPCRLERRKVPTTYKRQYASHINKINIESIGQGQYFGIQVEADNDNDRRLILEDFTISMNCGKWPKDCLFSQWWGVAKTCLRLGSRVVGKAMVGSTVNAMLKGGGEFKKIWDLSSPLDRNQNGQTKSGLYSLFIDAAFCIEGFFDPFGFSVVDDPVKPFINELGQEKKIGAATYLKNELDSLKDDPEAYNEQLRQFPRTERDAFRPDATDCAFNLVKILEQIEHNSDELGETWNNNIPNGNSEIERGNFSWKDGLRDTEVIWNPNPEGRFWIAKDCHPPIEYRNKREKKMINGVMAFAPLAAHVYCMGIDPYNVSKSADNRGSFGSALIRTKMNTTALPNNTYILEYVDRAKTVKLFFEDMIMCALYYSTPFLCELSNYQFLDLVKERGYRHFSMNNPFKPFKDLTPAEKEFGGTPAQNVQIGEQQFTAIQSDIEEFIGYAAEETNRPVGQMGYMPFTRTLTQWKDFEPAKRTKYDAYIASSLAAVGCQKREYAPPPPPKEKLQIFETYDNTNNFSQRQ